VSQTRKIPFPCIPFIFNFSNYHSFVRPTQGFVEITIKDLENMLHLEVSRLWSRGVIELFTDSRAQYDHKTNSLTKFGKNLKVGDLMLRHFDEEGHQCRDYHCWRVVELVYTEGLSIEDLKVGHEYGVFVREKQAVESFELESVDLDSKVRIGSSMLYEERVRTSDINCFTDIQLSVVARKDR
jgi:hypothetical protein